MNRTAPSTDRWAPWWVYLVPILGINYLRQVVLPFGTVPEVVDVVLALSIAAVLFVAITAAYRAYRR
jgi:hypothetical protein